MPVQRGDDPATWDVASRQRCGLPGVNMAGFGVPSAAALRLVPHPAVMLAVEFGAGSPVVHDAAGRQQRGSLIAGPGFGAGGAVRVQGRDIDCVQVRLSPVVASAVLGIGPHDLNGTVVAMGELWGREADVLRERLAAASSWDRRFDLVETFLARRQQARRAVSSEVAWVWDQIVASRGLARVEGLAAEIGWSRKRLWSRFRSQLGMPPKRAAKLVRFDVAAHRLVAGQDGARVAAGSGYTDQSHLHRDVQAFTGLTPTTVADEPFLTVDDTAWPATTRLHRHR